MKLKVDKENGDLRFNEEEHLYWNAKNPEFEYTSITTLISKFYEKFDEGFHSRRKAMERLVSPDNYKRIKDMTKVIQVWKDEYNTMFGITNEVLEQERQAIIAEWRAINKESTDFGTAYHLLRENEWYDGNIDNITDMVTDKYLKEYQHEVQGSKFECIKNNFDLERENAVMPEFLIYYSCPHNIVHLAGQVDILIKKGNDLYIQDFKTNKDGIKTRAFFDTAKRQTKKMFYPLNHLEDTMFNHYAMQLSLYAWMLQKINPEFNIKQLKLIHVSRDGVETDHIVPYLKKEAENMIKHWKKQRYIELKRKNRNFVLR